MCEDTMYLTRNTESICSLEEQTKIWSKFFHVQKSYNEIHFPGGKKMTALTQDWDFLSHIFFLSLLPDTHYLPENLKWQNELLSIKHTLIKSLSLSHPFSLAARFLIDTCTCGFIRMCWWNAIFSCYLMVMTLGGNVLG